MTAKAIFKRATLFAGAALALSLATASGAEAACTDPAGPMVDWSNCDLHGANLIDAILNSANLRQASLSGANLGGANLTIADLSCAHLRGANLTRAHLLGADLSHATWTDGRKCAKGSIGGCIDPGD